MHNVRAATHLQLLLLPALKAGNGKRACSRSICRSTSRSEGASGSVSSSSVSQVTFNILAPYLSTRLQTPGVAYSAPHLSTVVDATEDAVSRGQKAPMQRAEAGAFVSEAERPASYTAAHKHVLLVLVGPPGSGKSTFCQRLQKASRAQWVRINQDTISGGQRGTRDQCLKAAKKALTTGNCIIDRCNLDGAQRRVFVHLARSQGCAPVCLVFALPRDVCIERAAARVDHEGGVQGKKAARIVSMMHSSFIKAGMPELSEGFQSMVKMKCDDDIDSALKFWAGHDTSTNASEAFVPATREKAHMEGDAKPKNAFEIMMKSSGKSIDKRARFASSSVGLTQPMRQHQLKQRFWKDALKNLVKNADRDFDAKVLYVDNEVVMIKDQYPKAAHHVLICPKELALDKVTDLTNLHVSILHHMRSVADQWIKEQQKNHLEPVAFLKGFHAVPSMHHLHLHVISTDFESSFLKVKKHWNSFNTAFFLDLDNVLATLEGGGRVQVDTQAAEALLKRPLQCHRCHLEFTTMPSLKQHIGTCEGGAGGNRAGQL